MAKTKKPVPPAPAPVIQPIDASVVAQAATLRDDALKSNVAYQWGQRPDHAFRRPSRRQRQGKGRGRLGGGPAQGDGLRYGHGRDLRLLSVASAAKMTASKSRDRSAKAGRRGARRFLRRYGRSRSRPVRQLAAVHRFPPTTSPARSSSSCNPCHAPPMGAGYGAMSGAIRWAGPTVAQKRGAVGFVLRSLSTGNDRFPHAGATNWTDGKGIPSMAISVADAEQLQRIEAMQKQGQGGPRTSEDRLGLGLSRPRHLGQCRCRNQGFRAPRAGGGHRRPPR
ncbi:MAG: hypothetical protein WDN06_10020 [Asticcacaulis sp.]